MPKFVKRLTEHIAVADDSRKDLHHHYVIDSYVEKLIIVLTIPQPTQGIEVKDKLVLDSISNFERCTFKSIVNLREPLRKLFLKEVPQFFILENFGGGCVLGLK